MKFLQSSALRRGSERNRFFAHCAKIELLQNPQSDVILKESFCNSRRLLVMKKDSLACLEPLAGQASRMTFSGALVLMAILGILIETVIASPRQGGVSASVQQIEHFPAATSVAGQPLTIEARVIAPGRAVVYLRLYYKSTGDQAFKFVDMRPAAQGYVGQIPANNVRVPAVQYFLVALLSDRSVVNYPMRNPFGQPIEVTIRENTESRIESQPAPKPPQKSAPAKNRPPAEVSPQVLDKVEQMERPVAAEETPAASGVEPSPILILSPEPNSAIAPADVVVAASFMTETAIDSSSIKVLLDGKNVTNNAEVSPAMISFTPAAIVPGEHTVAISAREESGRAIGPINWRFRVSGQTNQTVEASSSKKAQGVVYAESRREQFNGVILNNNNIGADLSGSNGALQYSASAYFTSLEDAVQQPRNRFVISAGLPWLKLTLGDATPYFHELLLWGRRVRGIQAGLNTGWINFDVVTGETVRQVDPLYVVDSLTAQKTRQSFGTFKQTLLGLRPSFGSRNGFYWGFTLLKVRDDKNSLPPDTSNVTTSGRVTPRDNLVAGTDISLALDRRRFEIKASSAWSLLTNDIAAGSISADSIKKISDVKLPFDPKNFESWFILNESTSPLDLRGKTSLAYQVALNLNYFNHFINAGYKRIGSEYLSLAQSFLRNDIRGFFINDRWRMARNRVYLNAGLESYRDHFNTVDQRPATRLNTVQLGVAIFWEPNLPSFNFSFRNNNRNNNLDTTLFRTFAPENNATRDLSFTLNYDFTALNLEHSLMLNLTNSDRADNIRSPISGDVASNLKTVSLRSRFQAPLTGTLTFATNDNDIAGGQSLFKYKMFSGRGDYDFSQKRTTASGLQVRAYGAFSRVSASGGTTPTTAGGFSVIDYTQTGFQFGGALQYDENHEFTLDINLLNYDDRGIKTAAGKLTTNPSFKNRLIRAYYAFRF